MLISQFIKSNKKLVGLMIGVILIISGIIPLIIFIYFADSEHPYTISQITLNTSDYKKITAMVYTPKNMSGKHPGVVIGHGFTGNALHMQLLAIELVKREFVVVSINFRGHGNSGGYLPAFTDPLMINIIEQDMLAGMEYLKSLGNINKIGLLGHSMGAMTALKTSEDYSNQINATVILGMSSGFEQQLYEIFGYESVPFMEHNLSKISNLLIANGKFEQMFTEQISLNFLKEYLNLSEVSTETQYGDFSAGNACKVVMGSTEHLFESFDYHIIYESVTWFELAFYGTTRWEITITSVYCQISFFITLIGLLFLGFIAIVYINKWIWKGKPQDLQKDLIQNSSLMSTIGLIIFYIISMIIGVVIMGIGVFTLGEILPVSLGELLYGILLGTAIGCIIMFYLFVRKKVKMREIPSRIRKLCSKNYIRSTIYGIISVIVFIILLTLISCWTFLVSIPTIRELGAILGMTILFFPWFLLKEFYFRNVQGNLKIKNPIKEYFAMFGIGFIMDSGIIFPLMAFLWGTTPITGFLALALTVVVIFSFIQQCLVTWIYIYSGRNILGSAIFLSIFYAWMIVNFYPFGLPLF